MNLKNKSFLTEGADRKKGGRYVICSYKPTFHSIPSNFQDAVKILVRAGYKLMKINHDCDALLCKNTYTKTPGARGQYRYEWRYVAIQD